MSSLQIANEMLSLIKESESHAISFFLLGFFFLFLLSSRSSCSGVTSGCSSGRCSTTTTSHGGKLGQTFSYQFFNRFSSQLLNNNFKGFVIRLNTNGAEDSLDAVSSNLVTTKRGEK